jgi:hypothetical protein
MTHTRGTVEAIVVFSTMLAILGSPFMRAANASEVQMTRVLQETPVSPAADIPADDRKECADLGDELPKAIVRANRSATLVATPTALSEKTGRYLFVEITKVEARGGGAFTGPKHIKVRGALIENGKEIADFEAKRGTMAAAGTCTTLQKAEKDLGADIGVWLTNPKPHAHLGD